MIGRVTMAVCLSFLAGFVDALGFMHLGGYFVAFMSGNSTQMAAGLPDGFAGAVMPASIIGLFVLGVILGTLLDQNFSTSIGLLVLAAILGLSASLAYMGLNNEAIFATPVVMGAMNTVIKTGQGIMAVTFMTGNLVKFGQSLVLAFQGGGRWAWLPYLLLWLGLIGGVFCGVTAYDQIGLAALWVPAGGLVVLAFARLVVR